MMAAATQQENGSRREDGEEDVFPDSLDSHRLTNGHDTLESSLEVTTAVNGDLTKGPKIVETVAKRVECSTTLVETETRFVKAITSVTNMAVSAEEPIVASVKVVNGDVDREEIIVPEVKTAKMRSGESVIEREIRLQREREVALARERELARQALQQTKNGLTHTFETENGDQVIYDAVPATPVTNGIGGLNSHNNLNVTSSNAETKIALEIREMRAREEELRQMRQRITGSKENLLDDTAETFHSIPTTDEGNYSECGSDEKELSLDGNNSRMMSPEVPQGGFSHQRTQSLDSMSSGHSSGHSASYADFYSRRRVVVKPLDEPEDDQEIPTYMRSCPSEAEVSSVTANGELDPTDQRNSKETPIEREIRFTREREEELRRDKGLPPIGSQSSPQKQEVRTGQSRPTSLSTDPRGVQHRIATSRIQQEIDEATQRERELRDAGRVTTTSEDTVDSKVTRFTELAEYAIEKKLQQSTTTQVQIPVSNGDVVTPVVPSIPATRIAPVPPPSIAPVSTPPRVPSISPPKQMARSISTSGLSVTASSPSNRRFGGVPVQKGIMERFLASRGKLSGLTPFSPTNGTPPTQMMHSPVHTQYTPVSPVHLPSVSPVKKIVAVDIPVGDESDSDEVQKPRRGYTSAEEKIQEELKEMKRREEELRLQRAHLFAQSQPNLLALDDDEEEDKVDDIRPITRTNGEIGEKSVAALRSALSNPNLLDCDEGLESNQSQVSRSRKRSALIAQWENRIQQNQ